MSIKLINITRKTLNVIHGNTVETIAPSKDFPNGLVRSVNEEMVEGCIFKDVVLDLSLLPAPVDGVYYIIKPQQAACLTDVGRNDLVVVTSPTKFKGETIYRELIRVPRR